MAVSLPLSATGRVLTKSDQRRSKQVLRMPDSGDDGLTSNHRLPVNEQLVNAGSNKPAPMKVPVMRVPNQSTLTELDSMITMADGEVTRKAVYSYDGYGRRIFYAIVSKNTVRNAWDTTTLIENQYNDAGYELLSIDYYWDFDLEKTIPNSMTVSVYGNDGNNNLTMVKTSYTWQIDNSSWLGYSKQDVVFMGQQNKTYMHLTEYSYDTEKGWVPTTKQDQLNNVEGYSSINSRYTWDTSLQKWVGLDKSAYLYDEASNFILLESHYDWSIELDTWYKRMDVSYLSDDVVEMEAYYNFNTTTQNWDGTERTVYDYNGDEWFDKLTIAQKWDPTHSVWVNDLKTGEEYDEELDKVTRYVEYDWDELSGTWKGITYFEKKWDYAGNLTQEFGYSYSDENKWVYTYYLGAEYDNLTDGEWLITTWMESHYNNDGQTTSYKQMYRTSSLSAWDDYYTFFQTFTFNEAGTRIQLRTYSWDDTYKVWVNSWKRDYTVNDVGDYAYSIYYDWNVTDWSETSRNTYFYSQKAVGLQPIKARLDVYPNPVADRLVINGATEGDIIIVRDLNGRTIQSLKAFGKETTINTSNLARGTYLVQVGKQVVKIIK